MVIHLERKEAEDDWRVELTAGKAMETDGVNRVGLMGQVEERTVQGWGYAYWEAPVSEGTFSTLIGVPPDKKPVMAFETYPPVGLMRHNSRLPVVVNVPEGHEVSHRLWRAATDPVVGKDG